MSRWSIFLLSLGIAGFAFASQTTAQILGLGGGQQMARSPLKQIEIEDRSIGLCRPGERGSTTRRTTVAADVLVARYQGVTGQRRRKAIRP